MAKGKSQNATWYCTVCNKATHHSYYDKRRDGDIVKELSMFCNNKDCHSHQPHKRKDTKKGN